MGITGWSLVRFLHVTAAMVWVGGQILFSGVVIPAVRSSAPPETFGPIARAAGTRFGVLANFVVIPTLLATGLALAYHRGVTVGMLDDAGYGRMLGTKIALAVVSVALAAGHGILTSRQPVLARTLAAGGLVASLAVVVFATALVP
ncbi:MAG: hypothetical protein GXY13_04155 [Acidimicrobiales bacterium]|nr:hypothetical protein [Acidimicrobiales bacterium]